METKSSDYTKPLPSFLPGSNSRSTSGNSPENVMSFFDVIQSHAGSAEKSNKIIGELRSKAPSNEDRNPTETTPDSYTESVRSHNNSPENKRPATQSQRANAIEQSTDNEPVDQTEDASVDNEVTSLYESPSELVNSESLNSEEVVNALEELEEESVVLGFDVQQKPIEALDQSAGDSHETLAALNAVESDAESSEGNNDSEVLTLDQSSDSETELAAIDQELSADQLVAEEKTQSTLPATTALEDENARIESAQLTEQTTSSAKASDIQETQTTVDATQDQAQTSEVPEELQSIDVKENAHKDVPVAEVAVDTADSSGSGESKDQSEQRSRDQSPEAKSNKLLESLDKPDGEAVQAKPEILTAGQKTTAVEKSEPQGLVAVAQPVAANTPATKSNPSQLTQAISATLENRSIQRGLLQKGIAAPSARPMDARQVRLIQRVAKAFQVAQVREGPIRLRLSPPELGALRIEINVKDGVMTARIETETTAARQILMENLPQLRDRLNEMNITIDTFEVEQMEQESTDQSQGETQAQEEGQGSQQRSHRQQDSAAMEEVVELEESESDTIMDSPVDSNGSINVTA
ncbi:MAG: hypothetical protein COA78_34745 [Blastopirellula sp.]|nr:MAG: hypothetical protein COA78_34745 [Blastopirellula sp.]